MNFITLISFVLFAVFFLVLSKSKKNYKKLVINNGKEFADKVTKGIAISGYLLMLISLLGLIVNFFKS